MSKLTRATIKDEVPFPRARRVSMKKMNHILVVDDEVDITETFKMLLEHYGYSVLIANNALDALTIVSGFPPDLILSDCMMPGMDGVEFSKKVRLIPGLESVPIILMSGAPERHDLNKSAHTLFLRKPVFFERLLDEIKTLS